MRHIHVPRQISTHRPRERIPIPRRRRNPALQNLFLFRAVPLSVNQPVSAELQRPFRVLTWRVLAVLHPTCRKIVVVFCSDGGATEGGGGGLLLAAADKVREKTEEED